MTLVIKPHTFTRSNANEAYDILEKGVKKYLEGGVWNPKSDATLVGCTWDCYQPDREHMLQGVWYLVQRVLHKGGKRAVPRIAVMNGGSTIRFVLLYEEAQ